MNTRIDVKGLVNKYNDNIIEWRSGFVKATWEWIIFEICNRENIDINNRPSESGFTRAWRNQTRNSLK